ncbi:uncharacterized protein LOC141630732 [Silene latifolia]|uniref:uncharacterized protein LOC141630732 n=1 Tax=Silene latifolia TaxID=37657 RepID=UPI003D786FAD
MGSLGFWNVRGLNNPIKQQEIKWFLHQNKLGLFGLLETKIKGSNWIKVRNNICEDWVICTNNITHKGGRVWLLWDPTLYPVDILAVTSQCIHSKVFDKARKVGFWYTLVYGFNKNQEMEPLWQALKGFSLLISGPWLVGGDFNSITETKDRIGGFEVAWTDMALMRSMMSDCQLYDMKASGSYYTWNNKHEDETRVYSRIDRVLMNDQWFRSFSEVVATFLPEGLYDHCPCLISTDAICVMRKASFKYYNMWALSDDFAFTVENSWHKEVVGTQMFRVVQKLKKLKPALQ